MFSTQSTNLRSRLCKFYWQKADDWIFAEISFELRLTQAFFFPCTFENAVVYLSSTEFARTCVCLWTFKGILFIFILRNLIPLIWHCDREIMNHSVKDYACFPPDQQQETKAHFISPQTITHLDPRQPFLSHTCKDKKNVNIRPRGSNRSPYLL